MGVFTTTDEYICPIPPARLFKAFVLDSHNLIPKIMPQAIKSIEIIQGDGRAAGSIKQINVAEGQSQLRSAKIRVDELDEEKCVYNHSLIEGDALMDKLEYVYYDVKFEPTPEGGSKNKVITKFHTKDGIELNDDVKEQLKARKDRALVIYKAVEAYLVQNPDAYA